MDARPTAELPEHPNPGHTGLQVRVRVPRASGFTLDVDARLAGRGITAVLGPSGCGKSSLLYLLAGLEQPSAGELLCDGARVAGPAPERSMIFQEASLYPWLTVLDNVALGLRLQGVE